MTDVERETFRPQDHVRVGLLGSPKHFEVVPCETKLCEDDRIRRFRLVGFTFTKSGITAFKKHMHCCAPSIEMEIEEFLMAEAVKNSTAAIENTTDTWIFLAKRPGYDWQIIQDDVVKTMRDFLGTYQEMRHVVGTYKIKDSDSSMRFIETMIRYNMCDALVPVRRDRGHLFLVDNNRPTIGYSVERSVVSDGVAYTGDSAMLFVRNDGGSIVFEDVLQTMDFELQKI